MLNGIASILASLGFGIIFNIKGDKLISAALIGGAGGVTYYFILENGYSQVIALFVASIVISLLSEIFARIQKCPATTFLLCALIPLVPGGGMYNTMLEVVRNNIDGAFAYGVDTIIQACSIAIGCMLMSSLFRMMSTYQMNKKENQA